MPGEIEWGTAVRAYSKRKGFVNMRKSIKKISAVIVCLSVLLSILNVNGIYISAEESKWEAKVTDQLLNWLTTHENSEEKAEVYVWYKDINHAQVEKQVEEKTGLKKADLALNSAEMKFESLNKVANLQMGLEVEQTDIREQMEQYLKQTEKQRQEEYGKVKQYLTCSRETSKKFYQKNVDTLMKELDVGEKQVTFQSTYAPMLIVEMTYEEIVECAKDSDVEYLDLYEDAELVEVGWNADCNTLDGMKSINGFDTVYSKTGLTGKNVTVGMMDGCVVDFNASSELSRNKIEYLASNPYIDDTHSAYVARIINGSKGIAPNAFIYSVGVGDYSKDWSADADGNPYKVPNRAAYYRGMEKLMDAGVMVINCSAGFRTSSYNSYSTLEKWMDYLINVHGVTVVNAAGNYGERGERIVEPGLAYNIITVGAMDDNGTTDKGDDSVYDYSSYNHLGGCQKPDIIAPANVLIGGTSSAAPVVTSTIALMLELKPSLALYPQVIKAILMASCQRKALVPAGVPAETMSQGLTNLQGAGVLDPLIAISIVGRGQYGLGEFTGTSENIRFVQPPYGASNMNISVAWMLNTHSATGSYGDESYDLQEGTIQNINMNVFRNDSSVKNSENNNSSSEMAYVSLSSTQNKYRISLTKATSNAEKVCYGYAWGTDKHQDSYKAPGLEGIYYLRNKKSNKYLESRKNDNTIFALQNSFVGSEKQQWIVKNMGGEQYHFITADNNNKGILTKYSTERNLAVIKDIASARIKLIDNGDGTYRILQLNNSQNAWEALGLDNNAVIPLSPACWSVYSGNDSQKWYLEKINYQKGDVNQDGTISQADSQLVLKAVQHLVSFTEVQVFLGDIDGNGVCDQSDVKAILNMALHLS